MAICEKPLSQITPQPPFLFCFSGFPRSQLCHTGLTQSRPMVGGWRLTSCVLPGLTRLDLRITQSPDRASSGQYGFCTFSSIIATFTYTQGSCLSHLKIWSYWSCLNQLQDKWPTDSPRPARGRMASAEGGWSSGESLPLEPLLRVTPTAFSGSGLHSQGS